MLRTVWGTKNDLTFPISGTGSAGMETCVANLVAEGDKVFYSFLKNDFRSGPTVILDEEYMSREEMRLTGTDRVFPGTDVRLDSLHGTDQ